MGAPYKTRTGHERPRYRCVTGPKPHDFRARLPIRHAPHDRGRRCDGCDREIGRGDGIPTGYTYEFAIAEIARTLIRLGQGASYRHASKEIREAAGKLIRRSQISLLNGEVSKEASLALDYTDAFAEIVLDATSPKRWPDVVIIDAGPIRVRETAVQSQTGRRSRSAASKTRWHPPDDGYDGPWLDLTPAGSKAAKLPSWVQDGPVRGKQAVWTLRKRRHPRKRNKIRQSSKIRERGLVFMATGRTGRFRRNEPVVIRFMPGRDEQSWAACLASLPGEPRWVVTDRDGGLERAVKRVWPNATHYFSQYHLAANAGAAAYADKVPRDDPLLGALEQMQADPDTYFEAAVKRAQRLGAARTEKWLADNEKLICVDQPAKRAANPDMPLSTGDVEAQIGIVMSAITKRAHLFHNADRLDRLLALIRNDMAGVAKARTYLDLLRGWFVANDAGRAKITWSAARNPAGTSSIDEAIADASLRTKSGRKTRQRGKNLTNYRRKMATAKAQRATAGLPPVRGHPPSRNPTIRHSVAGMHYIDFPLLMAQWHPTKNGSLRPEDVPAGSGWKVWSLCDKAPDHEWEATARSRVMRDTGCPFCTNKRVCLSNSIATTHPDVAAQWHPKNERGPETVTYGSSYDAWWQCPRFEGHVWQATVRARTMMMSGCPHPRCSGKHGGRPKGSKVKQSPRVAAPPDFLPDSS